MLIFAFLWIRSNWTLWLGLIFTALMWWNIHAMLASLGAAERLR